MPVAATGSGTRRGSAGEELRELITFHHLDTAGVFDFLGVELGEDARRQLAESVDDDDAFQQSLLQMSKLSAGGASAGLQGDAGTFVTFVKGFVGIGILTLPYAMACGGYVPCRRSCCA